MAAVDEAHLLHLSRDGVGYLLDAVAYVDADGAGAAVDVPAAILVPEIDTLAPHHIDEVHGASGEDV